MSEYESTILKVLSERPNKMADRGALISACAEEKQWQCQKMSGKRRGEDVYGYPKTTNAIRSLRRRHEIRRLARGWYAITPKGESVISEKPVLHLVESS